MKTILEFLQTKHLDNTIYDIYQSKLTREYFIMIPTVSELDKVLHTSGLSVYNNNYEFLVDRLQNNYFKIAIRPFNESNIIYDCVENEKDFIKSFKKTNKTIDIKDFNKKYWDTLKK